MVVVVVSATLPLAEASGFGPAQAAPSRARVRPAAARRIIVVPFRVGGSPGHYLERLTPPLSGDTPRPPGPSSSLRPATKTFVTMPADEIRDASDAMLVVAIGRYRQEALAEAYPPP